MILAITLALALQLPTVLRWAGDAEGGAPFVEADPSHPDELVGFDVEIAALMAHGLGRVPRFVNDHVLRRSISRSRAATRTSA